MMFKRDLSQDELQSRYPAIFAESEKDTLSDKYLYIPTYKLIEGLQTQGFKVVGAKQQGTRTTSREHAKHIVYMTHETQGSTSLVNRGDEIPMLALSNSHNGLSSFAIDTAFFRLVCSNGLLMPTSAFSSARIVHKIGMERDVIEAATRVVSAFPEQIRLIESMKSVNLNVDEKRLLAQSASNLAFEPELLALNASINNNVDAKLLRPRRTADDKSDLWTTFNVIQENIIKGGFKVVRENEQGQRSIARTRAVNSIDRDAKLNRELMALAAKMLELKTA